MYLVSGRFRLDSLTILTALAPINKDKYKKACKTKLILSFLVKKQEVKTFWQVLGLMGLQVARFVQAQAAQVKLV